MSEIIEINGLCAGYGRDDIIKDISLSASGGQLIALMGPNGSGKTTLLRALLGLIRVTSGNIRFLGRDAMGMSAKERARHVSFIPQFSTPPEGFTVEEIVAMGRNPHDSSPQADRAAVESSMERMGLENLRDKYAARISGGEYQRVLLARALAQESRLMLLDEPTAHMDIKHRMDTMRMLAFLKSDKLIIGVFHDLDLVKNHADRAIMMKNGKIVNDAFASSVITEDIINSVFEIPE